MTQNSQPTNQPPEAVSPINEMDKAIRCLALELPAEVWEDVNKRWQRVKATPPATVIKPKDASRNIVQLSNVPNQEGISNEWLLVWNEIEKWYGDIQKRETGAEFLKRMQKQFPIATVIQPLQWVKELSHEQLLKVFLKVSLIDLSDCEFEYSDPNDERLWINALLGSRVVDAIKFDGNIFWMMNNDNSFAPLNPMSDAFNILLESTPPNQLSGMQDEKKKLIALLEWMEEKRFAYVSDDWKTKDMDWTSEMIADVYLKENPSPQLSGIEVKELAQAHAKAYGSHPLGHETSFYDGFKAGYAAREGEEAIKKVVIEELSSILSSGVHAEYLPELINDRISELKGHKQEPL